jgi:hypothetical protein
VPGPADLLGGSGEARSPWTLALLAKGLEKGLWKLSDQEENSLLTSLLLAPPLGKENKPDWAKVLVVLGVRLSSLYTRHRINVKDVLRANLEHGGTAARFGEARKVLLRNLVHAHLTPGFCQCQSWPAMAEQFVQETISLRVEVKVFKPIHGGRRKQRRTPHKLFGVTPKRRY